MKKIAIVLVLSMLICCFAGCGASSDAVTLNVLNWGDYIDEELLDQFTEETGIEVNYQTMATNEEMLVKLEASDCIYDVIEFSSAHPLFFHVNELTFYSSFLEPAFRLFCIKTLFCSENLYAHSQSS